MAESFAIKCGLLQSIIEKLQCFRCEDVPGPNGVDMNRYNCFSHSHSLCEKCKNDCPCNSPVGENPQPILQQLVKDLPWYCPNYKKGCRSIFDDAKMLEDHYLLCVNSSTFDGGKSVYTL